MYEVLGGGAVLTYELFGKASVQEDQRAFTAKTRPLAHNCPSKCKASGSLPHSNPQPLRKGRRQSPVSRYPRHTVVPGLRCSHPGRSRHYMPSSNCHLVPWAHARVKLASG